MNHPDHCGHGHDEATDTLPRPGRKLIIVGGVFALVLALSFVPLFSDLNASLLLYLSLVWWAVLLGLVLGGVIDYFVPDGFVARFLGQRSGMTLVNAVFAGLLMSACSHGILAIAIQLYKKGASIAAVMTFLLASPWANLPMTILLFGFFGLQAIYIIVGAMLVALISGVVYMGLERAGLIEASLTPANDGTIVWSRVRQFELSKAVFGVTAGAIRLANMVLWWILIGILAAAVIAAFVPQHWFMQYLGADLTGMSVTLLFATVIEVCSEGTSPLAFEIYDRVGVLGNPFIFLMAGVATDYTEIGLLWSNIGKRTAIWLPIVTVPQILLLAYLMNLLL